jgi:hypothetical protein
MNTNEVKGKLWNICIEKGLFNKVKGENFRQVQEVFEKIVKSYESLQPSQDLFDKVIDSLALEIQNGFKPNFEEMEKEYKALLNPPEPKKIDFTDIGTMNTDMNMSPMNNAPRINLEEILMTQNKILIQILEAQMRILDLLK